MTKHVDIDQYKYFGYRIGFDRKGFFSRSSGETGRNVVIFGVDMSSSTKIDNRIKDTLILGKGPTQGFKHTLSAEKVHSINFAACIIMEPTVNYLLMVKKFINSKQKILKL